MRIINLTTKNYQEVLKETLVVLESGGLVVFPSDTVYGLLADATNPKAVSQLLKFKERKPGQAISVFVADQKMAEKCVRLNQNAINVFKNLLPGPFTVVCESKHQTDSRLEAENGTLAIRIPDYFLITSLVAKYGKPLTATSANLSGKKANYSISSFTKNLSKNKKSLLSLIVDAGNLPRNKPSTVVDTTTGQLKTLRFGDFFPASTHSLISNSEQQTKKLAQFLAAKFIKKSVSKPLVFLLEGELGAGKTIFAKGLGKALGIKEEITSPTFNISNEYLIKLPKTTELISWWFDIDNLSQNINKSDKIASNLFIHYDLYRIEAENELKEIDFLESFSRGNVYAIEWPERIPAEIISALKNIAEIVHIKIKHLSEFKREIEWSS